jgi:hypothetical protein
MWIYKETYTSKPAVSESDILAVMFVQHLYSIPVKYYSFDMCCFSHEVAKCKT